MLRIREYISRDINVSVNIVGWNGESWPDYAICKIGDTDYIVGTSTTHDPSIELMMDVQVPNAEYGAFHPTNKTKWRVVAGGDFFAVYRMNMDIFIQLVEHAESAYRDSSLVPDIALKLCREVGLPLSDRHSEFDFPDKELYEKTAYTGIPIEVARDMLRRIYTTYLCWLYLIWDVPLLSIPEACELAEKERISYIDACRLLMHITISDVDGKLAYDASADGHLKSLIQCGDLYSAALVYMASIVTMGDAYRDGLSVAICANCGAEFLKDHGNRTLCEQCRTNKEILRAYRRRQKGMKEAATNGKQTK